MRRMMHKGRKRLVKWVREQPDEGFTSINTQVSVIPNTTLAFFNVGDVDEPDEPEEDTAGPVGTSPTLYQGGIAKQFTQDPGIRYERIVGDFGVSLTLARGFGTGGLIAPAVNILVRAGLCIMRTDEAGATLDLGEWSLGRDTLTALSIAKTASAMERRWLWRREWILSNPWANTGSVREGSIGDNNTDGLADNGLPINCYGPTANWRYQALALGAHLDIKPKAVAVPFTERLSWVIWARDMAFPAGQNTGFTLNVHRSCRTLVSRAPRAARRHP